MVAAVGLRTGDERSAIGVNDKASEAGGTLMTSIASLLFLVLASSAFARKGQNAIVETFWLLGGGRLDVFS